VCQREQCLLLGEGGEILPDVGEVPVARCGDAGELGLAGVWLVVGGLGDVVVVVGLVVEVEGQADPLHLGCAPRVGTGEQVRLQVPQCRAYGVEPVAVLGEALQRQLDQQGTPVSG
jgi:hypothetical protein